MKGRTISDENSLSLSLFYIVYYLLLLIIHAQATSLIKLKDNCTTTKWWNLRYPSSWHAKKAIKIGAKSLHGPHLIFTQYEITDVHTAPKHTRSPPQSVSIVNYNVNISSLITIIIYLSKTMTI